MTKEQLDLAYKLERKIEVIDRDLNTVQSQLLKIKTESILSINLFDETIIELTENYINNIIKHLEAKKQELEQQFKDL